ESDDSCHPRFLERLAPEFYDPEVVLAYCQSAIIGPDGERCADNFLAHTDDLSTTRWRSWYSVPGVEEVEQALSQKNTIPNASARSLGQTVLEYNRLTEQLDLKRPTLTRNSLVASPLNRIRATLQQRRATPSALKILMVVNDMEAWAGTLSAIHLANALAK